MASFAGLLARAQAWRADASHSSIAQKVAGSAFLIRVVSAALVFGSQILFARWMGSFEFGIYVYVWAWVLVIGEFADLGLASAAQRFIPEYSNAKSIALLRGFIAGSRWLTVAAASAIAVCGALAVKLLEPLLADYVVLPLMVACVTLPFYALMQMQDGIARSYNWVQLALMPMYVIRHVVMLAMVGMAYAFGLPTDAVTVVGVLAFSLAVTAIGQTIVLNRRIASQIEHGGKASDTRTWFAVSLPMLMVGGFYLMLTHTDILVLQQFRPPRTSRSTTPRRRPSHWCRSSTSQSRRRSRTASPNTTSPVTASGSRNFSRIQSAGRSGRRLPQPPPSWSWASRC